MNFYLNQLPLGYDEVLSRHLRRIESTIIPTIITSSSASSCMRSFLLSKSSVIRILIVAVKNYNTQIVEGFTCRKRRLRSTFLLISLKTYEVNFRRQSKHLLYILLPQQRLHERIRFSSVLQWSRLTIDKTFFFSP